MTPDPSTVLVLGARGRFGLAAVRAFARAGWRVVAQVRPGGRGPALAGVQWVAAAPDETACLAAAAAGAQVVVHALSPAYTHRAWRAEVPRLTAAAIAITRSLGATMLLPASVYNFGAGMPAVLREDTPQRPTTFKGRMRLASEEQIRAATLDGAMKAVVVRGGDFFGSGDGSWFDKVIVKDLPRGRLTYPGTLDVPTAWAYLPDMAECFVRIADHRARLGAFETLHFGGYSLTGAEWAAAATQVARAQGWLAPGQALRAASLSWPLLRLAGLVVPTLAALAEMRYLWRTPHRLDNTRLRTLIGEEPHTPFPVALRAALGERGLLPCESAPRAQAGIVNATL